MKVFSQKILAKIMWCWKWIYLSKINYYKLHTFPWSFNETPRKALRISRVRLWPFAVACTTGTFSFSRYTSPGWIFKWSLPNGMNSWGSPAVIIASLPSRFIKIYGNHTSAIKNTMSQYKDIKIIHIILRVLSNVLFLHFKNTISFSGTITKFFSS